MFLKLVLLMLIGASMYFLTCILHEKKIIQKISKYVNDKNQKYYEDYLKNYEKMKKIKLTQKLNLIHKINVMIDRAGFKRGILINPIMIILFGVVCTAICYILAFKFFKTVLLALIISAPTCLIPIMIIEYVGTYKQEKLEKIFLNFLLQLKNHIRINKDIVGAFKEVQTVEPLKKYIEVFALEVESGIRFERAIEGLKEKITIVKFKDFFSNLQYCFLYGGDISTLIDKSYVQIEEIQKEKLKRLEETKSARIVLIILMILNLFVYISYVNNNYENYLIMKNSMVGNLILYWNFISMWILMYMEEKVKKLDY